MIFSLLYDQLIKKNYDRIYGTNLIAYIYFDINYNYYEKYNLL